MLEVAFLTHSSIYFYLTVKQPPHPLSVFTSHYSLYPFLPTYDSLKYLSNCNDCYSQNKNDIFLVALTNEIYRFYDSFFIVLPLYPSCYHCCLIACIYKYFSTVPNGCPDTTLCPTLMSQDCNPL